RHPDLCGLPPGASERLGSIRNQESLRTNAPWRRSTRQRAAASTPKRVERTERRDPAEWPMHPAITWCTLRGLLGNIHSVGPSSQQQIDELLLERVEIGAQILRPPAEHEPAVGEDADLGNGRAARMW